MKKPIYLLLLLAFVATHIVAQERANSSKSYTASVQTGKVMLFDGKTNEDIITPNAAASSYDLKNAVENVFVDKNSGSVFFTASQVDKDGYKSYLTWKYNTQTKQLSAFRDGKIESIAENGDLTIGYGGDVSKGTYPRTIVVVTSDGIAKNVKKTYKN